MNDFYHLKLGDAFRAGELMADAFKDDPVWKKLFEGETDLLRKYQAFFEVPIRLCLKYGTIRGFSKNLEGIIAYVPGKYSDLTFWRFLRIGALGCGMRMGMTASIRMSDLRVLSVDRSAYLKERPYIYLMLLGVVTKHQGKGYGGSMLRSLINECDENNVPIYLETETEENVTLYEHFGFKMIKKIILENLKVPMWEMIREPHSKSANMNV